MMAFDRGAVQRSAVEVVLTAEAVFDRIDSLARSPDGSPAARESRERLDRRIGAFVSCVAEHGHARNPEVELRRRMAAVAAARGLETSLTECAELFASREESLRERQDPEGNVALHEVSRARSEVLAFLRAFS